MLRWILVVWITGGPDALGVYSDYEACQQKGTVVYEESGKGFFCARVQGELVTDINVINLEEL